jgi:hypothetical protein
MRADVTTREYKNLGERVGAVVSNQTEPIGPSTQNKRLKLLVAVIMMKQRGTT